MHGSNKSDTATVATSGHEDHHEVSMAFPSTKDGHGHEHSAPEKAKPTCCIDYCGVAALTCASAAINHPRSETVLVMLDDMDVMGQLPPLHRPPNI